MTKELAKQSELEVPVIDGDEVWTWDEVSTVFAALPPLGFLRVYALVSYDEKERIRDQVRAFLESASTEVA